MDDGAGSRTQSATGLDAVFSPVSVAVVGASPRPGSVGHRILDSLLSHGFTGSLHPIHPTAPEVLGLPAYRTVLDVPGEVDLAILAVPAVAVLAVARQCAAKGVRGLVVVTAGFRETGPAGAEMERQLGDLARRHGMRLVGPNCLGIINADPMVRLHAIFSDTPTDGGSIALMTQSGALGIALLERAHALGLGIGRFASMGNKVDVSGNDLLLHWESDPGVRLILMHLESVGNPRNFVRIARRVMATKPILLVKGGRTSEGARAAGSHTGAMMDADTLVDATLRQPGVVRVATVEELFDAALALSLQPLPAGNRIAVVTNSGGPAILLADALPAAGLTLAAPAAATLVACAARLPPGVPVANPLDLLAGASPTVLADCVAELLRDPGVDAVLALATPLAPDDLVWADAIVGVQNEVASKLRKPLVAVLFGRDESSAGFRRLVAAGVPVYTFPENAALALGAMQRVAEARGDPAQPGPPAQAADPGPRRARPKGAAQVPGASAPTETGERRSLPGWVSNEGALAAVASLGARIPATRRCAGPEAAADAATVLGFPVAIKVEAEGLVHKTEAGAVRLGLRSAAEVLEAARAAWQSVQRVGHAPQAILVQEMAPPGVEMLVGAVRDPKFGPFVTVGLGGIYAEALRDTATRLAPVTPLEAGRMIASLRAATILAGVRGEPPRDVDALRDFIVALGDLLNGDEAIAEVEVNPLRVLPKGHGVVAVDARLRLLHGGEEEAALPDGPTSEAPHTRPGSQGPN